MQDMAGKLMAGSANADCSVSHGHASADSWNALLGQA